MNNYFLTECYPYYISENNSKKHQWLREEFSKGNEILITEIESKLTEIDAARIEGYYTRYFFEIGHPLVNSRITKFPGGKISIPTLQYSLDGKFIKEFKSAKEASEELNIGHSNIICCCLGKTSIAKGYIFRYKISNRVPKTISIKEVKSKPVLQYDLNGNFIQEWKNSEEASRKTKIIGNGIRACCNGKTKSSGNFMWRYKINNKIKLKISKHIDKNGLKPILQYDIFGNFIAEHKSISSASEILKTDTSNLSRCCKNKNFIACGFLWRFKYKNKISKKINVTNLKLSEKPVLQYTLNGKFIREFKSPKEASILTQISRVGIATCCRNKIKQSGGFIWIYKTETNTPKNIPPYIPGKTRPKQILQYDKNGNFIKEFNGLNEILEQLHIEGEIVSLCCYKRLKSAKGFMFKLKPLNGKIPNKIKPYKTNEFPIKPVLQYTMELVFIRKFNSIREAARITNTCRCSIKSCCDKKYKYAGGYVWKFEE